MSHLCLHLRGRQTRTGGRSAAPSARAPTRSSAFTAHRELRTYKRGAKSGKTSLPEWTRSFACGDDCASAFYSQEMKHCVVGSGDGASLAGLFGFASLKP